MDDGRRRPACGWCDTPGMTSPSKVKQVRRAAPARGGARSSAAGFALAVAVYLSLALLAAQTLGLMHGILHSPAATANQSSTFPHKSAADAGVSPGVSPGVSGNSNSNSNSSASLLTQLFSGHLGDADCRAYDHLSHFDAAPGCLALALPLVLTPFLLSTLTGLATARWHALFQARGPPSLR